MADEYVSPSGAGHSEIVEKRSKFIGFVNCVNDAESAKSEISRVKAQYHDARHNAWCYITEGTERYSDDSEPSGTAGLPMLEVFKRMGISNVVCVVTRYFGGVLLGPGGLVRAYSDAAKKALENAGTTVCKKQEVVTLSCAYNLYGHVKSELENFGACIVKTEYLADVTITAHITPGGLERLNQVMSDISSGSVAGVLTGSLYIKGSDNYVSSVS